MKCSGRCSEGKIWREKICFFELYKRIAYTTPPIRQCPPCTPAFALPMHKVVPGPAIRALKTYYLFYSGAYPFQDKHRSLHHPRPSPNPPKVNQNPPNSPCPRPPEVGVKPTHPLLKPQGKGSRRCSVDLCRLILKGKQISYHSTLLPQNSVLVQLRSSSSSGVLWEWWFGDWQIKGWSTPACSAFNHGWIPRVTKMKEKKKWRKEDNNIYV